MILSVPWSFSLLSYANINTYQLTWFITFLCGSWELMYMKILYQCLLLHHTHAHTHTQTYVFFRVFLATSRLPKENHLFFKCIYPFGDLFFPFLMSLTLFYLHFNTIKVIISFFFAFTLI